MFLSTIIRKQPRHPNRLRLNKVPLRRETHGYFTGMMVEDSYETEKKRRNLSENKAR